MKKEIKIPAIERGVVVDHIPAGQALKVINILKLDEDHDCTVSIGMNMISRKMGRKDLIKIENKFIYKTDLEKISLVAPKAKISFISNYKVKEKIQVHTPDIVKGVIKCRNNNCVTNHQNIKTKFHLVGENPLKFKCHYCERIMHGKEIRLI